MEYNGKNYELIHDKTGNLDCPDCAFGDIDCGITEAVNKCNMYQVWKECAHEKETEQQSNCNLPAVSNNEVAVEPEKHKCINCGKEYEDIDDAIMCCYVSETDC